MTDSSKYNNINIRLIPNPQYADLVTGQTEHDFKSIIDISAHQIERLTVLKSYKTHMTDITLELIDMQQTPMANLSQGKYLVEINISPASAAGNEYPGFTNYYLCSFLEDPRLSAAFGAYPTGKTRIELKSVMRQRLEVENHFGFVLGGKGGGNVRHNMIPLTFIQEEFYPLFLEAYSPGGRSNVSQMDRVIMDFQNVSLNKGSSTIVQSTPDSGYKIETDTNLEAIDFIMDQYAPYKTPFGWVLDDFNTNAIYGDASILALSDFMRYDEWKPGYNRGLSALLGTVSQPTFKPASIEGIPNPEDPNPNTQTIKAGGVNQGLSKLEHMSAFGFFDLQQYNTRSYFNVSKFLFKEINPLLYLQPSYGGAATPITAWNSTHRDAFILTTSGRGKIHTISKQPNPMYKHYITFMNEKEVTETQKFRTLFFNLHPELATYKINNIWIGEIDLHDTIYLDKNSASEYAFYGKNRYGKCYQVEHVFEQMPLSPAKFRHDLDKGYEEAQTYTPVFSLNTEFVMLLIDEGPIELADYDNLPNLIPNINNTTYTTTNYPYIDPCKTGDTAVDIDNIPTAASGGAGYSQVADQAKIMIDHGFTYKLGGTDYPAMDCSAFTMHAVRNSGIDAGRKKRYPNGTWAQWSWLTDQRNGAERVNRADAQAGDIIFFKSPDGNIHGHTGIVKDNTSYYDSSSYKLRGAHIGNIDSRSVCCSGKKAYIFRIHPIKT